MHSPLESGFGTETGVVSTLASALSGAALLLMAVAVRPISYLVAWMLVGLAITGLLDEPAFAVVTEHRV